jgi:hypothetical protein
MGGIGFGKDWDRVWFCAGGYGDLGLALGLALALVLALVLAFPIPAWPIPISHFKAKTSPKAIAISHLEISSADSRSRVDSLNLLSTQGQTSS